jgi:DNA-binding NtrC family response regulator
MPDELDLMHLPILLVDDEPALLRSSSIALRTSEFTEVITCNDSRLVSKLLDDQKISVLVVDLAMPYLSGQQLLKEVSENHPHIPVIVMTATNDLELAVQCMREGAIDYLLKPVEKNRLVSSVRRALELRSLRAEVISLKEIALSSSTVKHEALSEIVTQSQQMLQIFRYLEAVSPSPFPVFITGESGTGKELVAQAIHQISGRTGAFVKVNVASYDDNIFSDALFGHVKGAFSDAIRDRGGLVKKADEGTLFLDEIGELSVASQVKLLRLIQDGTYYPIGSDDMQRSKARIVVATNCDVTHDIEKGKFRKDLYYRLATHQVKLPSLRSRSGDIPLLVGHFIEKVSRKLGKPVPNVPRELFQLLVAYNFPGNIRELETMCEDAIAQHKTGILSLQSFRDALVLSINSDKVTELNGTANLSDMFEKMEVFPTIYEAENSLVAEAMRRSGGNQGIAAGLLGISRQAVNRRLVEQKNIHHSNLTKS